MPDPQQLLPPPDDAPDWDPGPGKRPERARKRRPAPEPVASALAVADAADAQLDIPMRARTMLARRLHRYGAILDDPESTAADVVAVGRALAHLGGLGDPQSTPASRQPIQIAFVVQGGGPVRVALAGNGGGGSVESCGVTPVLPASKN